MTRMFEKMKVKNLQPGDINLFQGKLYLIVSVQPPKKTSFWSVTFIPQFYGEMTYSLGGDESVDIYRQNDA
jgi:hypothetical protein